MRYQKKKIVDEKAQAEAREKIRKLIAQKWFLPLDELCQRVDVGMDTLYKLLRGYYVGEGTHRKLIEYLEAYEGKQNGFGK